MERIREQQVMLTAKVHFPLLRNAVIINSVSIERNSRKTAWEELASRYEHLMQIVALAVNILKGSSIRQETQTISVAPSNSRWGYTTKRMSLSEATKEDCRASVGLLFRSELPAERCTYNMHEHRDVRCQPPCRQSGGLTPPLEGVQGKSNFPIIQNFLKISLQIGFFVQTRKILPLGFVIYYKFTKDLQYLITQLASTNQIFFDNSWKFSQTYEVSIAFLDWF